jgi:hypothetical protein
MIGLSTIYAPFLIFLGWSANEFYANVDCSLIYVGSLADLNP